jgi:predicted LPLAT superfamily acyltransferase
MQRSFRVGTVRRQEQIGEPLTSTMATNMERGSYHLIRFTAAVYRRLGQTTSMAILAPVVIYFYLTGRAPRRASLEYLRRARAAGAKVAEGHRAGLAHAMAFAEASLDKFAAWTGAFTLDMIEGLEDPVFAEVRDAPAGAIVVTAHIGSPEVIRAVATLGRRRRIYVLVDNGTAAKFNSVMQVLAPESHVQMVEVSALDVGTAAMLSSALDEGAWIVTTADRVGPGVRSVTAPFLGAPARLPEGPWILAAALKAPLFAAFCPKEGKHYRFHFTRLADRLELPRADRAGAVTAVATRFAGLMEQRVIATPLQWFNFFDYWTSVPSE